jgi:hypothetical protein
MEQIDSHLVPPKRRSRLSCIECRRRKVRCSRTYPCNRCLRSRSGRPCTYDASVADDDAYTAPVDNRNASPSSSVERGELLSRLAQNSAPASGGSFELANTMPSTPGTLPFRPERPSSGKQPQDPAASHVLPSCATHHLDQFQEPLDGRTVSLPNSVVRGQNDRIRYWGRSHYATPFSSVSIGN